MAQQLPPAGEVGGKGASQAYQQRLDEAGGGEAQQVDGIGAIKVGQRLGELPHEGQRQQAAEQQPEQGAYGGENEQLQGQIAEYPAWRHPQDDELGELGAAHALHEALGVEHQKQSHRHGEQGEGAEVEGQGIPELAGIEGRADGLEPERLMGVIGLQRPLQGIGLFIA
ncbi:hypothetical protein D3C84_626290 [compost metagenome]